MVANKHDMGIARLRMEYQRPAGVNTIKFCGINVGVPAPLDTVGYTSISVSNDRHEELIRD